MTPLHVELLPPFPWRSFGMGLATAALTVGAVALGWATWSVHGDVQALTAANAELEARIAMLKAQQQAKSAQPPYLKEIGELVGISRFPLDRALTSLEQVDVPGTRVIDLDVDVTEPRAVAVIEATSALSLQRYLEGLAAPAAEGRWELQSVVSGVPAPDGAPGASPGSQANPPALGRGGASARISPLASPTAERGADAAGVVWRATIRWR